MCWTFHREDSLLVSMSIASLHWNLMGKKCENSHVDVRDDHEYSKWPINLNQALALSQAHSQRFPLDHVTECGKLSRRFTLTIPTRFSPSSNRIPPYSYPANLRRNTQPKPSCFHACPCQLLWLNCFHGAYLFTSSPRNDWEPQADRSSSTLESIAPLHKRIETKLAVV